MPNTNATDFVLSVIKGINKVKIKGKCMFGTRVSRKKTSMKSRPSEFTLVSRKSRGASASRKSRRASTSRFYSRQKSRMSDQPQPKIFLGESLASIEPEREHSDAPDREMNLREEQKQKFNAVEKREALKRAKERAAREQYRLEQQRKDAEQRKADDEYGKYMEKGWW